MIVKYATADGEIIDINTTSEVAELIAVYERQDANEGERKDNVIRIR